MNESEPRSAFPWVSHGGVSEHQVVEGGLTKREYFAAMAMQGLLASWGRHDVTDFNEIAQDAFNLAAAMIKEGEK